MRRDKDAPLTIPSLLVSFLVSLLTTLLMIGIWTQQIHYVSVTILALMLVVAVSDLVDCYKIITGPHVTKNGIIRFLVIVVAICIGAGFWISIS